MGQGEQAAQIKQGRIARITFATIAAILIPVLFYGLLQNRSFNRLKVSGIATTARLAKKEAVVLGQYWNGRPVDRAIIRFNYNVASGETAETSQTVTKSSVAKLSVGDEFTVWYDRAYPSRVLTPWNDDRGPVDIRITAFILSLLVSMVAIFAVTRARGEAVRD